MVRAVLDAVGWDNLIALQDDYEKVLERERTDNDRLRKLIAVLAVVLDKIEFTHSGQRIDVSDLRRKVRAELEGQS